MKNEPHAVTSFFKNRDVKVHSFSLRLGIQNISFMKRLGEENEFFLYLFLFSWQFLLSTVVKGRNVERQQ